MSLAGDHHGAPEHRNGKGETVDVDDDGGRIDRRMVFFVIGGILLAFAIGLTIMIAALMMDWQK